MNRDYWITYCLEWVCVLGGAALVWPVAGVLLDMIIFGVERKVGPK